jgi:transmembrane sensor
MDSSNPVQSALRRSLIRAMAWRSHFTETETESSADFEAWLAADPIHAQAWRQVQEPWEVLDEQANSPEMIALRRTALGNARAISHKRSRKAYFSEQRLKFLKVAGVAVVLAGAVSVWMATRPDVYRTAMGEHRTVNLSDGSTVILDASSEVRVGYSRRARDLSLIRGQARFVVASDVERPFSVRAAEQKVVAIGTAFNIDRLKRQLVITLLEGNVVVVDQSTHVQRELRPGEQLVAAAGAEPLVSAGSVERATAWESGLVMAENEPLGQVAERISRYSDRAVEVVDAKAAALKVNGVFKAGDVDRFVMTVMEHFPLASEPGRQGAVKLRSLK